MPVSSDGSSGWNSTRCLEIMGEGAEGDECIYSGPSLGTDDCGENLMCWDLNDANRGTCTSFCADDSDCTQPDARCEVQSDGVLPLCQVGCDPLIQDCPDGQGCYLSGTGVRPICVFIGMELADGEPCNYTNYCAPGLVCYVGAEGCTDAAACCTPWCDTREASCPGATEECSPIADPPLPGLENVGVCVVP